MDKKQNVKKKVEGTFMVIKSKHAELRHYRNLKT